jgi:hypothetical protein
MHLAREIRICSLMLKVRRAPAYLYAGYLMECPSVGKQKQLFCCSVW